MRIALLDIAAAAEDTARRPLTPGDEFVDIPDAAASPIEVDVLIASRFAAKDATARAFRLLQVARRRDRQDRVRRAPRRAWVCNAFEHEVPIAEYVFAAMLDHATRVRRDDAAIAGARLGRRLFLAAAARRACGQDDRA